MCEAVIYFLLGSCLLVQLVVLGTVMWAAQHYIKARRWLSKLADRKMDNLIDELLEAEEPTPAAQNVPDVSPQTTSHRVRLAAIASGGQARHYLGKALTAEQIDAMADHEIEMLYTRYEARLGASMTKTLGQAALQLYTYVASLILPIPPENRLPLQTELQSDPFVGHAINGAACELYHRYGMCLAPLTAGLTTAKYCQFKHRCPRRDTGDDGEPGDREPAGREPADRAVTGAESD